MARRKRQLEEEHENHERWLVSYADMITVLMALFIVLYAMSQVDESKYEALKQSLSAGFGQQTVMMHHSTSVLDSNGAAPMDPMVPAAAAAATPEEQQKVDRAVTDQLQRRQARTADEARREAQRLLAIMHRLNRALADHDLADDVRASIDERGLALSLVSQHVVFNANLATLTPRGQRVLDVLAPVLRELPDPLRIDGHTNQVDVKPKYYETDWDLSAARAITVLRHLHERGSVPNERLTVGAFGMERPLVDPDRPGSQRINKRVDIIVLSSLPPASRALLEDAVAEMEGRKP